MKMFKAFSVLAGVTMLAACSDSDVDVNAGSPLPPPPPPALVQIVHASADAPLVDVLINGAVAGSGVDFKSSSGYIALDAGVNEFEVQAILPDANVAVIGGSAAPLTPTLAADTLYTIVALDNAASITGEIYAQPLTDVSTGATEISVLHAAPGVGDVDVFVTAVGADLAASTPLTVSFAADPVPTEFTSEEVQIRVAVSGSTDAVFDSGPIDLPPGLRLFVTAVPNTRGGASPVSLIVATPDGAGEIIDVDTPAAVRAVHNANDAPEVNVYADGATLFTATFPGVTDIAEVDGGTYTIEVGDAAEVYPAGVVIPGAGEDDLDLTFAAGTTSTVIAHGTILNDDLAATQLTEDTRPVALYSKVRIFHGASTAPGVDVYLVEPGSTDLTTGLGLVAENIEYPSSTGFATIPAGTYDAIVTLTGTETIAIGPAALPELVDGGVYNVIARDPMEGSMDFGLTVYGE